MGKLFIDGTALLAIGDALWGGGSFSEISIEDLEAFAEDCDNESDRAKLTAEIERRAAAARGDG